MSENQFTLQAIFSKAITTVDGGWRISFDVDASESVTIAQLSQFRDTLLQLAIIPVPSGAL